MTQPLPKWLMQRYAKLWSHFKEKEFDYKQAKKVLGEKNEKLLLVIISDLKKNGWLAASQNSEDKRKSVYALNPIEKAISEIAGTCKLTRRSKQ